MDTKDKFIPDQNQFWALLPLIRNFPRIHNKLKADFQNLMEVTENHKSDTPEFKTLCRACLKNLFSLIEADIFYYNLFDKYKEYDDRHNFLDRFKKTFKQICKTWDREDLQKEYFDSKLSILKELKTIRDRLTHPKEIEDIWEPNDQDFFKVKTAFKDYDNLISTIMSNFFFSTSIPL